MHSMHYTMEHFESLMASKSDEALNKYLVDIKKYTPEAIEAAITEFRKRGKQFSESELADIQAVVDAKLEARKHEGEIENPDTKYIVTYPAAPLYYSKQSITLFSILFSVLAGAILLAINLRDKPKAKRLVMIYGILYTIATIAVLSQLERDTRLTFFINCAGSLPLSTIFWNKYIGETTQYRAKTIWKPLIVAIVLMLPVFYFFFLRQIS